jgi:hypothetical protein
MKWKISDASVFEALRERLFTDEVVDCRERLLGWR